jgi:hypothetical protein
MPIHPNIPLALEPAPYVRMPDPWAQQARMLELRDLTRRDELERLKLDELRRAQAEEQAVREIFARHLRPDGKLDRSGVLSDLYRLNPSVAFTTQKNWLAQEKALSEADEARLKAAAARAARLGALAGSATDQASYQRALQQALEEGLLTSDQAAGLPATWDENTKAMLSQFQQQALTAQQQIDEALKRAQDERAKAEHEARLPGLTAESASKQFRLAGQLAPGAALTTTQWNALRAVLPENLRNMFPAAPYSGAVAEAERLAMTPEERQASADRAASRAEQERHNKETEKLRRERETSRQAERQASQAEKESQQRTSRLRTLKAEEQRLDREQAPLDEKRRQLGQILASGKHARSRPGKAAKDVEITPEERARYQAEYDSITERWQRILDRKKQIEDERRQLLGNGAPSAPGASPSERPAATAAGKPRQVDAASGRTVGAAAYTEEEFRRRARERGIANVEQALAEARRRGLVQ